MVTRLLRSERVAELFRYGMTSALSAVVTLGLPVLLHEVMGVPDRIAVGVAFAAAFVLNFITTRMFVFKSAGQARDELIRYTLTSAAFRIGEYLAFLVLHALGLVYYVAQVIVVLSTLALKFATLKLFVYRKAPPVVANQ